MDSSTTSAMNSDGESLDNEHQSGEIFDSSGLSNDDGKSSSRRYKRPSRERKWRSLRRFYNDDYLALLRVESDLRNDRDKDDQNEDGALTHSQIGAVTWTAQEKADLFHALAGRGRLDLPGLAAQVGSKSIIEVQAYLQQLQTALVDSHLFHPRNMGVSLAEIPAAIEINSKTERMLERAADALCMYQERYEEAAGREKHGDLWLTSLTSAKARDAKRVEPSDGTPQGEYLDDDRLDAEEFFNLPTMIELSEKVFMNRSNPSADDNWRNLVFKDEHPTVTLEFVQDMHGIIVNLTRKIMQASLFIAMSRIRAFKYDRYVPSKLVKAQDVEAAIYQLGMSKESWGFWRGAARRCGLQVVQATFGRGHRKELMSYGAVEKAMAERAVKRWGRRRNRSSSDDNSLMEYSTETAAEDVDDGNDDDTSDAPSASMNSSLRDEINGSGREDGLTEGEESESNEPEQLYLESLAGTLLQPTTSAKRKYKEFQQELRHEVYASRLDEAASQAEEARLLKMFDEEATTRNHQLEEDAVNHRPKLFRKTRDEIVDWKATFVPRHSWEDHALPVPEGLFLKTEREKQFAGGQQMSGTDSSASDTDTNTSEAG